MADGVWVLPGAEGDIGPANRGRIGNAGFIVGPTGVLMIDSGVSLRHGLALRVAVARVTSLPIRALVLTHVRQEFLFGALAFQREGVPVLMHRQAAGLMAVRCERCLRNLKESLGEDEMAGTALVKPDVLLDGPRTVSSRPSGGRCACAPGGTAAAWATQRCSTRRPACCLPAG